MKNLLAIVFSFIFIFTSGQELSNYEKYKLEKEKQEHSTLYEKDTVYLVDTVYLKEESKETQIINNYYDFPTFRSRLIFGHVYRPHYYWEPAWNWYRWDPWYFDRWSYSSWYWSYGYPYRVHSHIYYPSYSYYHYLGPNYYNYGYYRTGYKRIKTYSSGVANSRITTRDKAVRPKYNTTRSDSRTRTVERVDRQKYVPTYTRPKKANQNVRREYNRSSTIHQNYTRPSRSYSTPSRSSSSYSTPSRSSRSSGTRSSSSRSSSSRGGRR